jgi:ribonucleoside-triphosphate reductase (formate)
MAAVMKRDGTEEPFDIHKLIRSMKQSGLDGETAAEVAEGIEYDITDEDVSTDDIRSMVEDELRYYKSDSLKRYGGKFA